MNSNTFLIATREFRQIARTKSFWLTLLILPVTFALMPLIMKVVRPDLQQSVMGGHALELAGVRGEVQPAQPARLLAERDIEAGRCVEARPDCRAPLRQGAQTRPGRLQPVDAVPDLTGAGIERRSPGHRHRVPQMGAADLHHIGECRCPILQGGPQHG